MAMITCEACAGHEICDSCVYYFGGLLFGICRRSGLESHNLDVCEYYVCEFVYEMREFADMWR